MTVRLSERTELIAQQVRLARERAGLTQDDVAARLGLSRAAYGHYERGRTAFQIDVLFVLADLLDLHLGNLLGLNENLAQDEALLLAAYRKLNGSRHQARVLVAFLELCQVWAADDVPTVAGDPALMDLFVARQSATRELAVIKQGKIADMPAAGTSGSAAAPASEGELLGYLQELGPQGRDLIQKLLERLGTASSAARG